VSGPSHPKHLLFDALTRAGIEMNRLLTNPSDRTDDTVWVCGDGRSGTTWLANIINHANDYRFLFEPLHPVLGLKRHSAAEFLYLRPHDDVPEFQHLLNRVFLGRESSRFVDMFNKRFFYAKTLVKDIFSHLYVKWVDVRFPQVKKVVIIRHPIAAALSKLRLRQYHWMTDAARFLSQPELMKDLLWPFEEMMREKFTYVEHQVLIWSVAHYVLFKQCFDCNIHYVFFEDLNLDPDRSVTELHRYLYNADPDDAVHRRIRASMRTPSETSFGGTARGMSADAWKDRISERERRTCDRILQTFGLDRVYSDDGKPNRLPIFAD